MRRRHPKGRFRKGRGSDHGPSTGGTGHGSPHGGMERGIPVPGGGRGGSPSAPGLKSSRKKHGAGKPPEKKQRPSAPSSGKRKRPISRGFRPQSIPTSVAGAETIIDDVIPVPSRRKKKGSSGGPRNKTRVPPSETSKRTRSPGTASIQSSDTVFDDMDLIPSLGGPEEQKPIQMVPPEDPAYPEDEAPTPPDGTLSPEEDVLEPVEEKKDLDSIFAQGPAYEFRGSGMGLLGRQIVQVLCAILGVVLLLSGGGSFLLSSMVPAAVAETIPADLIEALKEARAALPGEVHRILDLFYVPLGAGAFFLLLAYLGFRAVKHYRIRHTWFQGEPVSLQIGLPASLVHGFVNLILLLPTLGLAFPWIVSGNVRFRMQHCFVKARRRAKPMDFSGTGGQVLVLLLLSLISLPLIPLTLGVWLVALQFHWIRWEQTHLVFPSPTGRGTLQAVFHGTWGSLFWRVLLNTVLCSLTLGLFRPWATVARWRWIADRTKIPAPEEKEERRKRKGLNR